MDRVKRLGGCTSWTSWTHVRKLKGLVGPQVGAAKATHNRGLLFWLRLRGVTLADYSVSYFVDHFL